MGACIETNCLLSCLEIAHDYDSYTFTHSDICGSLFMSLSNLLAVLSKDGPSQIP